MLLLSCGCIEGDSDLDRLQMVWGRQGLSDGRFQKPRAIAVAGDGHVYVVDMTSRIQQFDCEGNFLRSWKTPTCKNGRPTGLSVARDGSLLVADTHYYRMLVYNDVGEMIDSRVIGGTEGHEPGTFGLVTDCVQDSAGNYYIAEYGEHDRIQKFSPDGKFLLQWGSHGSGPSQFARPQNLAIDAADHIWVADACNHRIQVFDDQGNLLDTWGESGTEPGQLYYPYDLALDGEGHVYVCEYGNHRVQKFTLDGRSVACWGSSGREPGQLFNPWALARDGEGRIHVLDSNNHRVQRISL